VRDIILLVLRAILFDLNGVLVDDEPLHLELFRKVLAEEEISLSEGEYFERYLGRDDKRCFFDVLRAEGRRCDDALLMRLLTRKASYYQERVRAEGFPFFPGALELIRAAAEKSVTLGVVSNALRREIQAALRQPALEPLFKVVVAAEDVNEAKPDPEGYLRALSDLNSVPPLPIRLYHPHEVLAVEDSPIGLEAAGAAGLVTLGVAHTYPPEELAAADLVVADLGEICLDRLQQQLAEVSRS